MSSNVKITREGNKVHLEVIHDHKFVGVYPDVKYDYTPDCEACEVLKEYKSLEVYGDKN